MSSNTYSIGIIADQKGVKSEGGIKVHRSFGRMVDGLARPFSKCYLCLPAAPNDGLRTYVLQSDNIEELIPLPFLKDTFEWMKHPIRILRAGKKLVDSSDIIFARGTMSYLPIIYLYAILKGRIIVHWVVGDMVESFRANPEEANLRGKFKLIFAWLDEKIFQVLMKSSRIYVLVNGEELYRKYKSARTTQVVSGTIKESEFYYRKDTCQNEVVRIMYLGLVRRGKGLEYLVEALCKLKTSREVRLAIVGGTDAFSQEQARLKQIIEELGITDKVSWEGWVVYGPELFEQFQCSDIFVLPSFSEGTPQVLVEARSFGLPVISTRVGGIPSSVTDGKDGLLVHPKDSDALAAAIDKIIEDGNLRRELISNGYATARKFTLEKVVAKLGYVIDKALAEKAK